MNGISLGQNDPNPADGITTITYVIPASVTQAKLVISEIATGREIARSIVSGRGSGRGSGQMRVAVKSLAPGTYLYSIIADGRLSASRKMAVMK